jgi:hypothetical protein
MHWAMVESIKAVCHIPYSSVQQVPTTGVSIKKGAMKIKKTWIYSMRGLLTCGSLIGGTLSRSLRRHICRHCVCFVLRLGTSITPGHDVEVISEIFANLVAPHSSLYKRSTTVQLQEKPQTPAAPDDRDYDPMSIRWRTTRASSWCVVLIQTKSEFVIIQSLDFGRKE